MHDAQGQRSQWRKGLVIQACLKLGIKLPYSLKPSFTKGQAGGFQDLLPHITEWKAVIVPFSLLRSRFILNEGVIFVDHSAIVAGPRWHVLSTEGVQNWLNTPIRACKAENIWCRSHWHLKGSRHSVLWGRGRDIGWCHHFSPFWQQVNPFKAYVLPAC